MRKSVILTCFMALLLSGCEGSQNVTELGALTGPGGVQLGMTRQDVIQTMLDEVQLLQMSGQVKNPYATRYLENLDGEPLEVMYYYTGMKRGDDLVTYEELAPIILQNDAVVGWGWDELEKMTGARPGPGS